MFICWILGIIIETLSSEGKVLKYYRPDLDLYIEMDASGKGYWHGPHYKVRQMSNQVCNQLLIAVKLSLWQRPDMPISKENY